MLKCERKLTKKHNKNFEFFAMFPFQIEICLSSVLNQGKKKSERRLCPLFSLMISSHFPLPPPVFPAHPSVSESRIQTSEVSKKQHQKRKHQKSACAIVKSKHPPTQRTAHVCWVIRVRKTWNKNEQSWINKSVFFTL
jgi:hypothetical protein